MRKLTEREVYLVKNAICHWLSRHIIEDLSLINELRNLSNYLDVLERYYDSRKFKA